MTQTTYTIKRMPVDTWRHFKANYLDISPETPHATIAPTAILPQGVTLEQDAAIGTQFFTTPELDRYFAAHTSYTLKIAPGAKPESPVNLTFMLDASQTVSIAIKAGAGSEAAVCIRYLSPEADTSQANISHMGRLQVNVEEGATLTLADVQILSRSAAHMQFSEAVLAKDATLRMVVAELGSAAPTAALNVELVGEQSALELDFLYAGDGDRKLDFTCRSHHIGRKTTADINAKGILAGSSRKIFRDTLDFAPGSKGSKARELENVLMLSPDVRNMSIPLLLCGEDDVEGEHAASAGRPDEGLLFYMTSRGITPEDAVKLITEAAVTTVTDKIPLEEVRQNIHGFIGGIT